MNQLALTCRQARPTLGYGQLQAFGVRFDYQFKQACFLCGRLQLIVTWVKQAKNEAFTQGTCKQSSFLRQETHVLCQQWLAQLGDVHVIE